MVEQVLLLLLSILLAGSISPLASYSINWYTTPGCSSSYTTLVDYWILAICVKCSLKSMWFVFRMRELGENEALLVKQVY